MNLHSILLRDKIEALGFDTAITEKPLSNLIDFNWKNILHAPPKNTSDISYNELLLISNVTKKRSKIDINNLLELDLDLDSPFIDLLEKRRITYPYRYISMFYNIVHPILMNIKSYWNRPRPQQLARFYNIHIDTIITDTIHTPSYPSGHTVYSSLVSLIIKDLYPSVPNTTLDRIVLDTARARILQGVHFPSDNQASLVFAQFVFDKLSPKLRKYYNE